MFFFFQAEDGIRDHCVTGVQTCALPISGHVPPGNLAELTGPLGDIVRMAVSPDRRERFGGVTELLDAIESVHPRPPAEGERNIFSALRTRWMRPPPEKEAVAGLIENRGGSETQGGAAEAAKDAGEIAAAPPADAGVAVAAVPPPAAPAPASTPPPAAPPPRRRKEPEVTQAALLHAVAISQMRRGEAALEKGQADDALASFRAALDNEADLAV